MSDWKDIAKKVAPTLASALLGPLGGIAVEVLGGALGADTAEIKKTIEKGNLTSDQLAAIQLAEIKLREMEQERGFKFAELEVQNTAGARAMQIATSSWVPGALAVGVTCGFFGILSYMLTDQYQASEPLLVMLGALGTAWASIVNFYFGSSAGSQQSRALIEKLASKE